MCLHYEYVDFFGAVCRGLACWGLGVSLTLKSCLEFSPLGRWCVFAIQIFAHSLLHCKAPFEARSSIRTNDSVSVQRDSARGSAGLFLTAYLNSTEIQNPKCMQMTACFACWYFHDLGLAYSGGAQYVPSFSNINQNYFVSSPYPWSLFNKHFCGWKACNLVDLLDLFFMKALLKVLRLFLSERTY